MNSKRVYILYGSTGSVGYDSDYEHWHVAVFYTRSEAEKYRVLAMGAALEICNKIGDRYFSYDETKHGTNMYDSKMQVINAAVNYDIDSVLLIEVEGD